MSSDDSLVDRVSSFVSENKRGIVIGVAAAAVAVGGVAYYVASSRGGGGAGDEENLKSGKKKDKKKKKHKKPVKDQDGPIIEESKPKVDEESDDGSVLTSTLACRLLTCLGAPDQPLTEEQIQALSTEVSHAAALAWLALILG